MPSKWTGRILYQSRGQKLNLLEALAGANMGIFDSADGPYLVFSLNESECLDAVKQIIPCIPETYRYEDLGVLETLALPPATLKSVQRKLMADGRFVILKD